MGRRSRREAGGKEKLVISGCEYSSVVKVGPVLAITRGSVGRRARFPYFSRAKGGRKRREEEGKERKFSINHFSP